MNFFMLVFWAPKDVLAMPRSAEGASASGEMWNSWQQGLRKAGHSVTGAQLEAGGRCVHGVEKTVVDGSFGSDYVMGGYFVVDASSLDQATALAKECPILQNGGTVEVRPILETG